MGGLHVESGYIIEALTHLSVLGAVSLYAFTAPDYLC